MKYALSIPQKYEAILDYRETENAIQLIKDFFQKKLADALNLRRITAPLFVKTGTGINDELNGIERPVSFHIGNMNNTKAEIVQSLAKWKRLALADLKIPVGEGIYTDREVKEVPENLLKNYFTEIERPDLPGHPRRHPEEHRGAEQGDRDDRRVTPDPLHQPEQEEAHERRLEDRVPEDKQRCRGKTADRSVPDGDSKEGSRHHRPGEADDEGRHEDRRGMTEIHSKIYNTNRRPG